jgi:predicted ATP-binding protein involved in virulence
MKVYRDGEILDILQLSDGEKCTLALFGDLARRLAIANPSLEDPLKGVGVALIDEIELHMHTSWQRKVIRVLKDTFPNVQFIITTHSPQVIGECGQDFQIFSLYRTEDEIGCDGSGSYFGLDSNSLLEDAFKTDSVNRDIKDRVRQMYQCIEDKDFLGAETCIGQIDDLTNGRNPDTARGRILIRKGRRANAADKEKS